jgi:hypothetical protein
MYYFKCTTFSFVLTRFDVSVYFAQPVQIAQAQQRVFENCPNLALAQRLSSQPHDVRHGAGPTIFHHNLGN